MVLAGYGAFIPHFKPVTFVTSYIGVIIYVVNLVFYKLWAKSAKVMPGDMDLHTDRLENTSP